MSDNDLILTASELIAEHRGRDAYVRQSRTCDSANGPLVCDLAAGHGGGHLDRRSNGTWLDHAEQEAGE